MTRLTVPRPSPTVPPALTERVVRGRNVDMAESYRTLWDLLDKSARSYTHRPLFGTKIGGAWRWITYDEFQKDTDRYQSALAGLGIGRGDRVAIVAQNSVEWAIAAYATFGRGAAFVPMYESQAAEEWEFIIRDSGAKVA